MSIFRIEGLNQDDKGRIFTIIGKNGSGKSTFLRDLDNRAKQFNDNIGIIKYISPERGGKFSFDAAMFQNMHSSDDFASQRRRQNSVTQFREMSFVEFQKLETLVLRKIESDNDTRASDFTFNSTLEEINQLIDNISVSRGTREGFNINDCSNGESRNPEQISSGEAEIICLAIEILSFVYQADHSENNNKINLLLIDEPDVHLHPDLQQKLANLITKAIKDKPICAFIATHSTAFLAGIKNENCYVCFKNNNSDIKFSKVNEVLENVIPIFGAHPLSGIFNSNPILLLEGEDDERVWQQALRTSSGRLKYWPCVAGDIQSLNEHEVLASNILDSVYDQALAYSLRDGDNITEPLNDIDNVTRFRLNCKASENLLLTDDVLNFLNTNWEDLKTNINEWLNVNENSQNPKYQKMKDFSENFDRQNYNLKEIRLILLYIIGTNKPWEVAIGQTIALLNSSSNNNDGSLKKFLGEKIVTELLKINF